MARSQRRRRVLIVGVLAAGLVLAPALPASANEPLNWIDPNYAGSVTDTRSITAVAVNNATATGAGVAPTQGCISAGTTPYLREDSESYTGMAVASRVWLYTNAYCEEFFELQYYDSDTGDWATIGHQQVGGAYGSYYLGEVRGGCVAGTWAYRISGDNWHSEAVRHTCTSRSDPFRIG